MSTLRNAERANRLALVALLHLLVVGCGGAPFSASTDDNSAGTSGDTQTVMTGGRSGVAGSAGTDSDLGGSAGAEGPPVGEAGGGTSGMSAGGVGGTPGGTSGTAGDTSGVNPLMALCATYGEKAGYDTDNQHCYLAVQQLLGFDAARQHCTTLGAHLATIADSAENAYVWSLAATDHWLGASDGKAVVTAGIGKYAWLTDEPFTYQAWTPGQPNAAKFSCELGSCYEHCLVQWGGGQTPGEWNDNGCTEALVSVCEWDK